jgi:hypothetical protein
MTTLSLQRRLEAAGNAFLGTSAGVVAPDPDAPAEVAAFDQKLAQLRASHHRQILIVNTGIRRAEN